MTWRVGVLGAADDSCWRWWLDDDAAALPGRDTWVMKEDGAAAAATWRGGVDGAAAAAAVDHTVGEYDEPLDLVGVA